MRWPARIAPGQVCGQVASTIDLMPTFAALAGGSLPEDRPIDGIDITSLIDDPGSSSPHDEVGFYFYKNGKPEAMRLGKWKLHLKGKKSELYDLGVDISEANDLAAGNPEKVQQLTKIAEAYDAELKKEVRPPWKAGH
jgi:arylsulfatase A